MRPFIRLLAATIVVFTGLGTSLGAQNAPGTQEPPRTGAWQWRFVAGGATVGAGAFTSDGTFYFAAEDRYLYAVDRNGTMVWRTDLGRRPGGNVVIGADGTLLVTLDNGELLALNPDGRLLWRERVSSQRPFAPVVLANGLIITVNRPGTVEARTHVGRLLWSADTEVTVSTAPVLTGAGEILVAGNQGDLVAVSVDGRILRRRYVGEVSSTLAVTTDGVALGSTNGRVIALDDSLEPVWRADVGAAVRSLIVGDSGDLYAVGDDGSLARVTPEGVFVWKAGGGAAAVRSALVSTDILVAIGEGLLTRLGRDAVAKWQMRLPDTPLSLGVAPYGAVVVTTAGWVTYAYRVGFVPSGPWPQERGASHRRGVAPGADSGRVDLATFERSVDYLALRARLLGREQSEQGVAMAEVVSRVESGEDLAGEHQYLLQLSERVAGSPYFGPLTQFGPASAARRAREQAIRVLGEIGDLASSRFLARLLGYEPDVALAATILSSMAALGTPVDAELTARLGELVRRDVATGANDGLGNSVSEFVERAATYRGGYIDPGIADVLLAIASANYSREVRARALATLRSLAGGRTP